MLVRKAEITKETVEIQELQTGRKKQRSCCTGRRVHLLESSAGTGTREATVTTRWSPGGRPEEPFQRKGCSVGKERRIASSRQTAWPVPGQDAQTGESSGVRATPPRDSLPSALFSSCTVRHHAPPAQALNTGVPGGWAGLGQVLCELSEHQSWKLPRSSASFCR